MLDKIAKELYRIICNLNVKINNKKVFISYGAKVLKNAKLEGNNKIGERTIFGGEMGRCSYIGSGGHIIGKIGRYCSIGNEVISVSAIHPVNDYVSTNPVFYSTRKQCGTTYVNKNKFDEFKKLPGSKYAVEIGNDCFVGHHVTFLGAVKIGDGAVVGANSVVTKDVEPYTTVAGNPAKVIRKRFTDEQIDFLLKLKWWDKPEEWICEHAQDFDNIEKFIEKYGDNR